MNTNKFRHEFKHVISIADQLEMLPRLKAVMKRDEFSNQDGKYKIRSLYFDNYHDKVLYEKIDGVNEREKFRIRYYNGDTSLIRIEKKSKMNGLCMKESAQISKEDCFKLINGNTLCLKNTNVPLFLELYVKMNCQLLRPRVIIDYDREAYTYGAGNVRVTFDSNIKMSSCIREFLNPAYQCVSPESALILEIKYDEFLPQIIRDITQLKNRSTGAFSKYAFARTF